MEENKNIQAEQASTIKISEEVVAIVAGIAATEITGVAGMSSSLAGGIYELLGKKNMAKGVKVEIIGNDVNIDLFIVVEYGAKIPDVAWEIQEKVKKQVETMTGLNVLKVNINVEGINIEKEPKKEEIINKE